MSDNKELGALPSDRAVVNGAASVSALRASVPSAWRRTMQMDWTTDSGVVTFTYPGDMTHDDIADVKELLEVAFAGMVRRAQAIETRRAETEGLGAKHESPVGAADAPKGSPDA